MNWRHLYSIGLGPLTVGVCVLSASSALGVELRNGEPVAATVRPAADSAPAPSAAAPGAPRAPHPEDAQPAPTAAAAAPAIENAPAAGTEVSPEEPQHPEDAAIQDELEDPSAAEDAGSADLRAESSAGPGASPSGVGKTPAGELFPSSLVVERQKAFWIHAFTAMTSRQGLLHDGRIIGPTYQVIDFDEDLRPKEQNAIVRRRIQEQALQLTALAERIETRQPLDEGLERLRALLPKDETPEQIRERVRYIRFQRGLSDRFRSGLVRSGAILAEVRRVMAEHGVPPDLAYLPHVESSFNNATLSRAGAAGIWQFTRGTGRIFLTVHSEVDERLDPLLAARAAAVFLKQNYDRLGTWPLAITAYNHGPQSLEKIVTKTNTTDLGLLIENYDGPLFKFASKNFYAEFLAARHVATHAKDYFGDLEMARPLTYSRVELPFFLEFANAARALGVATTELAGLNPSLRPSVLTGAKLIPKGFRLRVPPEFGGQRFLAAIPESARAKEQKVSTEVRVARGDTLFSIGRRNNIPWTAIAAANNLGPRSRIHVGQRLILPRPGQPVSLPAAMTVAQGTNPPAGKQPEQPTAAPAARAGAGSAAAAPTVASASAVSAEPSPDLVYFDGIPITVANVPVPAPAPRTGPSADSARPALTSPAAAPGQGPAGPSDNGRLSPLVSEVSLALQHVDPARQEGVVRAAYGETMGHYADWAQVPAGEIRARNRIGTGGALLPGRHVVIPLHAVSAETFNAQRLAYHRAREQSFFSAYTVRGKIEVELAPGQSMWSLAQDHNVPMWLLYRENPALLQRPAQAGVRVIVPRVEEAQPHPR